MRLEKINLLFSVKVGKNKIFNISPSEAILHEVYKNDSGSFSVRNLTQRRTESHRQSPSLINLNDEYIFVLGGGSRLYTGWELKPLLVTTLRQTINRVRVPR